MLSEVIIIKIADKKTLSKEVTTFLIDKKITRGKFSLHMTSREYIVCSLILVAIKKYNENKDTEHVLSNTYDLISITTNLYKDLMKLYPNCYRENVEKRGLTSTYVVNSAMKLNGLYLNVYNKKSKLGMRYCCFILNEHGEQIANIVMNDMSILDVIMKEE